MPHIRVLGLDPGLQTTGWGILDINGTALHHIAHGHLTTQATLSLSQRLSALYTQLCTVIQTYSPHEAAVEETFVNKNPASTLKLGMARGVILLAPAHEGLSVYEYSANRVKKALVGAGHADKTQVAMMVRTLLPTAGPVVKDAADALAIAICHAHSRESLAFSS